MTQLQFGEAVGLGKSSTYKLVRDGAIPYEDVYDRLTPTYAQNFLDDDSDPEDSRPWALKKTDNDICYRAAGLYVERPGCLCYYTCNEKK